MEQSADWILNSRTALSGQHKFFAVMPFLDTPSFFSNTLVSPKSKPLISTSPFQHVTLSAV